jgi:hypothetical protein
MNCHDTLELRGYSIDARRCWVVETASSLLSYESHLVLYLPRYCLMAVSGPCFSIYRVLSGVNGTNVELTCEYSLSRVCCDHTNQVKFTNKLSDQYDRRIRDVLFAFAGGIVYRRCSD